MSDLNNAIGIKIDFDKNSTEPQRVFDAMSDLIQSIQSLHSCFLSSISVQCEVQLLLSDIKEGSLISWLSPDIKNKNIEIDANKKSKISTFLDKSTQKVIEFLEDKETISNISELDDLEEKIKKEADNLSLDEFLNDFSLDKQKLLKGISSIGKATNELHKEDSAYVELNSGSYLINSSFNLSDIETKQLLSIRTEDKTFETTLVIKKAVFLGDSMWDFIIPSGGVKQAKMLDYEWIDKFHHRSETILPGDSLKCNVKLTISYDKGGGVVDEKYEVLRVLNKIDGSFPENGVIFDE